MKPISLFVLGLLLSAAGTARGAQKQDTFTTRSGKTVTITHIKHASVQITYEGQHIYVDPVREVPPKTNFADYPKARIILVTHEHPDHYDDLAISLLKQPSTAIYANPTVHKRLHSVGMPLSNGDSIRIAPDICLWAVPAYNTTPEHEQFHPKGRDNGYILELDGLRIYLAGDTEDIPEMARLKNIDVAFLPCNQPYTMTPDQLIRAATSFKPRVLFPYHYSDTPVTQLLMRMIDSGIDVRIRDYK